MAKGRLADCRADVTLYPAAVRVNVKGETS